MISFVHFPTKQFSEELEHVTRRLQRVSLNDAITRVVTPLLCFDFMNGYNFPVMLYQKKSIVLYRGTPETILRHAVQHARMRQYRDEMPTALIALMEKSLLLLERSNRVHGENAPAAVIFQAASDSSGVMCSSVWISHLEQLAATHYVALHILGSHENFGAAIREAKQEVGSRNIMTLLVRAHGSRMSLEFGRSYQYTTTDVQASDFACLDPRASIILCACKTGLGLAPCIAAVQPRAVFAAIDDIISAYFTPCCEAHGHGMFAFGLRWRQIAKKFQRHEDVVFDTSQGDTIAQHNLGLLYLEGRGCAQSYHVAMEWFMRAASQGYARAQNELAVMYWKGQGVARSYRTAVHWYWQAAIQGHIHAQYNLSLAYADGLGVAQSDSRARKWLWKAANRGHREAQFQIGLAYNLGGYVAQSYTVAANWFERAARHGHVIAQYDLAILYQEGYGVVQSYNTAAKWFQRAALQGYRDAQYNLALLYWQGHGIGQSYERVIYWFTQAAIQGEMCAQYNLGIAYLEGLGVASSLDTAREWLEQAAAQGMSEAQEVLSELRDRYDP